MTARIHDTGIPNRCDASPTYAVKGSATRAADAALLCANAGDANGVIPGMTIIAMMAVAMAVERARNRSPI
jgi:hypothetical protein